MKKQLVSILFALCMVLCLVPTAAFAEESTETPPECSCETACTAESMNAECPVCGAEGALPENCEKCAQPADDAAAQPEGDVSDPQPETALTALIGGSATEKEVSTVDELTKAIADVNFDTVKLTTDIDISNTLTVNRTVTLDLNGHVLKYENDQTHGGLLAVEKGGYLTIIDSNSNATHRFKPNSDGLWVLDENGSETVTGGVITGGTGYQYQKVHPNGQGYTEEAGGAVCVKVGGSLFMTGGNIVGCSAMSGKGGGVHVEGNFSMTGGSIIGCAANRGGGVHMAVGENESATFSMSGNAIIRCCKAVSSNASGGGVYVLGNFTMSDKAAISNCECIADSSRAGGGGVYLAYHNNTTTFTMSDNAVIENCKVTTSSPDSWTKSYGGGVFVSSRSSLTLKDQAAIRNCSAENTAGGATYGGGIFAEGTLTIAGLAEVGEGCSAAVGSGIYMEVGPNFIVSQNLYANGGVIAGEVVLNNSSNYGVTLMITGSDEGVTEFKGSVLNNNGIIEKGTFTGEVINNGTITGGTFNGTITGTPALATGSGTKNDPYQIGTADGLKWFRDKVNNAKTPDETKICVELTEDIDLSGEEWSPIGIGQGVYWGSLSYSGTFDGKGHTIKNLSIDNSSANFVGLFGYVLGGTIRNLTVSGSVKGSGHTGGIAGGADGGTFENCANLCVVQSDSTEGGTTGGIIGFALNMDYVLIVRDCYNVGSITGRHAGGIIGQCSWHETISNCYNAGTVTGTANAGAIIGSYSSDKISNCYYLDGSVIRKGRGDKASIAKTATEFADGTVRELLKAGERTGADPWADECKYLDAAGKTLPVFKGQGDTHNHQSDKWEHNDTEHWQVCTCGVVFNKAAHSGGKATCKAKAVCDICKESYGSLDQNSHADLKHIAAKAATAAEEGNIEYWHCGDCNKYFSDAAAKTEITRADTVTAKLPQPTTPPTATPTASPTAQPTTAPQAAEQPRRTAQPTVQPTAAPTVQPVSTIPATGDTSSPILWAALLLCSGAGLAVTAYKKNRHRS
ncbi:pectate lyase-like adhesive domain-containing protein [uncultured Gemmiger sp.]|uniref:pectate lyase-like adhesive domain-containing protein n=1 Tax=uncultured Gemmiger sp. TaxID=1623490 RepID=UPI00266D0D33|nr:pectate lyase-like adhesive domain-containing protein [uncultured Gemmiger sp.]